MHKGIVNDYNTKCVLCMLIIAVQERFYKCCVTLVYAWECKRSMSQGPTRAEQLAKADNNTANSCQTSDGTSGLGGRPMQ